MKTKVFLLYLLVFSIALACVPSAGTDDDQGDGEINNGGNTTERPIIELAPEGFSNIGITIELPENANYKADELVVSSLFTENSAIKNTFGVAQTFSGNAFELVYAVNTKGELLLMSFVNPSKSKEVVLNAESTAIAMVMLHPWTMHLSVKAKEEAVEHIIGLSDFNSFKARISNSIANNNIDFGPTNTILTSLNSLQSKLSQQYISAKPVAPLSITYGEKKVSIRNNRSSMVYGMRVYDEENNPIGKPIYTYGVNKSVFSFSNAINLIQGNFDIFQPTDYINIPIESKGKHTIKATSGSVLDGTEEGKGAAFRNSLELLSNIVGIFSSTLGQVFKNAQCGISIGSWAYNNLKTGISLLVQNKKTPKEFLSEAIAIIGKNSSGLYDIAKECSKVPKNSMTQIFKAMSIISNLENGIVTSLNIFDWMYYDSKREFCAILDEYSDFVDCIDIQILETNVDFGEQYVDSKSYKNITIVNEGDDIIFTLSLGIPGNNSSNPNSGIRNNYYGFNYIYDGSGVGELIEMKTGETKILRIKFEPLEVKNYANSSFWLTQIIFGRFITRRDKDQVFLSGKGLKKPE
ncbi:MAG: hypothetical protein QM485_00625 [Flavobacteriaceae bacterium]